MKYTKLANSTLWTPKLNYAKDKGEGSRMGKIKMMVKSKSKATKLWLFVDHGMKAKTRMVEVQI